MYSEDIFRGFSARKPRNTSDSNASPQTPLRQLPLPSGSPRPAPAPSDLSQELAGAFALISEAFSRAYHSTPDEQHNVREPDQFDGSNSDELRIFFAQLELVFKARPRTFNSEAKKVTYALSYLKGTALQWFEPYL
ncbi:hypothetical protein BV20DRAFT_959431, partial [Pilatotrama ljubarskyi]